jgi:hypothetical protein
LSKDTLALCFGAKHFVLDDKISIFLTQKCLKFSTSLYTAIYSDVALYSYIERLVWTELTHENSSCVIVTLSVGRDLAVKVENVELKGTNDSSKVHGIEKLFCSFRMIVSVCISSCTSIHNTSLGIFTINSATSCFDMAY